jgi:hypothetical protein
MQVCAGDDVEFLVFDCDLNGKDELFGRCTITYEQFYPSGFNSSLILASDAVKQPKEKAMLTVSLEALPIPATPNTNSTRCFVRMVSATNLSSLKAPYAICQVPSKPKTRFITKVKSNTYDPIWDEEAEIVGYEAGDDLKFTVMDHRDSGGPEVLGQLLVSSAEFHPDGLEDELVLAGVRLGQLSTIQVAIDVVVPVQPKKDRSGSRRTRNPCRSLACAFCAPVAGDRASAPVACLYESWPK